MPDVLIIESRGERFGIRLDDVVELQAYRTVLPLPAAPAAVIGICNLSGGILPVIDLQARLHGSKTIPSPQHVIASIQIGSLRYGLLVDRVHGVGRAGPKLLDTVKLANQTEGQSYVHD